MYVITKEFHFSASHQLDGLKPGHQCGRLHGHNYVVKVEMTGAALDPVGFVLDYGLLSNFGQWIDDHLDHRHLNDRMQVNPTAENLARYLTHIVSQTCPVPSGVFVAVGVSETPKTWAWFRP